MSTLLLFSILILLNSLLNQIIIFFFCRYCTLLLYLSLKVYFVKGGQTENDLLFANSCGEVTSSFPHIELATNVVWICCIGNSTLLFQSFLIWRNDPLTSLTGSGVFLVTMELSTIIGYPTRKEKCMFVIIRKLLYAGNNYTGSDYRNSQIGVREIAWKPFLLVVPWCELQWSCFVFVLAAVFGEIPLRTRVCNLLR